MRKVIDILGLKKQAGDIGIEIECEGKNMVALDEAVWRSEDDGSLRGAYPNTRCEYILTKPVKIEAVEFALTNLRDRLKEAKAVLDFSYRCSVHIHLNVQQLEYQQLLALMYTFYLLEEPFMTFCGKSRKGNNFCLRLSDAEGVLTTAQNMFELGEEGVHYIQPDMQRYASMNMDALKKYGSLEFRGMEGNMDVHRITTWCKALHKLREFAVEIDNPKEVYNLFQINGPVDFMHKVLGELSAEFHYLRIVKDIQKSFSISLDLPFAYAILAKKPKAPDAPVKDYQIGDVLDHGEAVDCVHRGGNVKGPNDNDCYVVTKVPVRPRKNLGFEALKARVFKVGGWANPVQEW